MGSSLCKDEKVHDEQSNKVREEEAMPPRTEPIENANDGAVQNRQIEMELKRDRMEERRVVKILLLGSADSGKSTIAKQMRILHTNGFNEAELINYRYMLHTNYIGTFHYIARGITQLRIEVPSDEMELVDRFENSYSRFLDYDDMDMIKLISKFLAYTSTKAACQRFTEFYVPDNTAYLLAEASRILSPEYQPTVTDVIHARASTTGVHEITFGFRRFGIRLIDVGGQKTERRKWIHCFDSVSAILYVISLSCYDQFLEEDPSINRMDDSIELFRAMFYNQFLAKCSFILFLNKKDLFEQKLKYVPLQKFYPPFEDCLKNMTIEDHYGEAVEFIKKLFLEVKDPDSNRHIYTHVTNATDTKNIEFVFGATCDIVLQNNLTKAGMT